MIDVLVVSATQIKFWKPSDDCYKFIEVGTSLIGKSLDYTYYDSLGDNISLKNLGYCELTGLYWAWKNTKSEIIGLCHYRRYFQERIAFSIDGRKKNIISKEKIKKILENKYDVILAKPRKYYIETVYSHYAHAHHEEDLKITRSILEEFYPNYLDCWDFIMNGREFSLYNMFIMRREDADRYCEWLFSVLLLVEQKLDTLSYNKSDARVYGYLGEFLLNVWVKSNAMKIYYAPVQLLQRQNWIKKITLFFIRKLKGSHSMHAKSIN